MNNDPTRSDSLFLDSVLGANRCECSGRINQMVDQNIPFQEIYETLFKPTLYKVGELWEVNKITVADEHLATSVIESLMNDLYPRVISDKRVEKKVVVACVENEMHQVGIKMVADVFESNGWDTYFLGSNVPTHELIKYIYQVKPDLVAISVSIYFHIPVLDKMITVIKGIFPELQILVGGQAFKHGGENVLKKYRQVTWLTDLKSVDSYIKTLMKNE